LLLTQAKSELERSQIIRAKEAAMPQVVIVDQTGEIDPTFLNNAALALNTQVTRDLPTAWDGISANVSTVPSLKAVPHGAWPVFLVKSLPPGEGGFHMDKHNQPFAKVIAAADDDNWTIDASHEILEMLVDPFGNRMHSSQAIAISGDDVVDANGVFNYLVEACDPCEANNFAYDIGGIAVSDFITPHFYDGSVTPNVSYSFKGNIKRPRQLLRGGYISYVQPDGEWKQILWVNPGPPQPRSLGAVENVRSLRLHVHESMGADLDKAKHHQRRKKEGLPKSVVERAAVYHQVRTAKAREGHLRELYGLKAA
jgi:hypothetical protein